MPPEHEVAGSNSVGRVWKAKRRKALRLCGASLVRLGVSQVCPVWAYSLLPSTAERTPAASACW